MSAQIIQFGNSAAVPPPRPHRVRRHIEKTNVRFVLDGELYEVEFYDTDVQHVWTVHYRVSCDGAKEIKRWRYQPGWPHYGNLDPEIVRAAKQARRTGECGDTALFCKVALTELFERREKLSRMLKQVEASIASVQGRISG